MRKPWNNQADDTFDETLISPRFDQKAISDARPVVPITAGREDEMTLTAARNFRRARVSSLISFPKPSWPLALVLSLTLFVVAVGAITIKRRSSLPSQNQAPASATAYGLIGGESDETARPARSDGSARRRTEGRGGNGYDRHDYYGVLPARGAEPDKGRDEDRGKFEKERGRGEEKRKDKADKGRDREKGHGKGKPGKGGD